MKIKVIKACTFSFAPAEKIVYFTVGEICELPEKRAKRLIDHDYAVEYNEPDQPEQKMDKIEPENKMFNVKHEDKAENEVKVIHEDSVEKEEEEKKEKPKKRGRPKKNK